MRITSIVTLSALLTILAASGPAHAAGGPVPGAATATTVKLPDGPGSVAGLADDAEVQSFTGQLQYSVPIKLPAGPGGFGPALALSYSGELGNGIMGVGWSLGVPAIRRSLRHGVPRYDDTDEFELVGLSGGRLIEDPAARDGDTRRYWVEGAGASLRVQRTFERWTVTTSDGVRYLFGLTEASRLNGGAGRVAVWNLELVAHPSGQGIHYTYGRRSGQVYLSEIAWGPSWRYRTRLDYEPRGAHDPVLSLRTGFEVITAERLRRIAVLTVEAGSDVELHAYYLGYDQTFPLSRLAGVRMTGYQGSGSLPVVRFRYATRAGDGRQELDTGGWAIGQRGTVLHDVDGDGAADLLRLELGNHAWRRNVQGAFAAARPLSGADDLELGNGAQLLDLDGDARAELVRIIGDTWRGYRLINEEWQSMGAWPGSTNVPLSGPGVALADIDGDGRTDVLRQSAVGIAFWRNGATGFEPVATAGPFAPNDAGVALGAANVQLHDLNGDGLADIVWLTDGWMKVFLGRGDGTFLEWKRVAWPWADASLVLEDVRLADLNRDGLTDLVRVSNGSVHYYQGRADGSFASESRDFANPSAVDGDVILSVVDANGNGSTDLVWTAFSGRTWVLDLAGATTAGMLTSIDNGLGKVTTFGYRSATELRWEDEARGQAWEQVLPIALPVPVSAAVDVGDGSLPRRIEYRVRNGFWDGNERRFGGFLTSETRVPSAGDSPALLSQQHYHAGLGEQRVLRGMITEMQSWVEGQPIHERTRDTWLAQPVDELPEDPLLRVPLLRQQLQWRYEGVDAGIESRIWSEFDGQGREIGRYVYGRTDLTGDETVVETQYVTRDAATWIGDLPCEQKVYGPGNVLVSHTRTLYGDATTTSALCEPGKGLVRKTEGWLEGEPGRWVTLSETAEYTDDNWNPALRYADGVWRRMRYDAADFRAVSETIALDDGALTWSAQWNDARGLIEAVVDPAGVESRVRYDEHGRVVSQATGNALPHVHYRYDWKAPRPTISTFLFDGADDELGELPASWSPDSNWRQTVAVLSGAGEELYAATSLNGAQWIVSGWAARDSRGRVTEVSEPFYWQGDDVRTIAGAPTGAAAQSISYDGLDRVVEQHLPSGQRRNVAYFAHGQTVTAGGLAPVTSYVDGQARIIRTERTIEGVVESVDAVYDAAGRITDLHLQDGAVSHHFDYDTLGRLRYAVDPDIGERWLDYFDGGQLRRHENGENQAVTYEYDDAGRLTAVATDESAYRYHYDVARTPETFERTAGRLAWIEEPTGTVDLGYDHYGRQTRFRRAIRAIDSSEELIAEETSTFTPSGQLRRLDYGGFALDYDFDPAGRLIGVGDYLRITDQDASGRVLEERYGNGIEQHFLRDALGQPTNVALDRASGEVRETLYDVALTYAPFGAIASITDTDRRGLDHTAAFTYDGAGRLTDAFLGPETTRYEFHYQYDALQNMTSRHVVLPTGAAPLEILSGTFQYGTIANGPRQLTQLVPSDGSAAVAFAYDRAGRQTEHDGRQLTFNALDQLVRVDGLEAGSGTVEHAYGYDGMRVYTKSASGDTRYWFSQGISEQDGVREHLVYYGERLIARVTMKRDTDARPTIAGGIATTRIFFALSTASLALILLALIAGAPRRRIAHVVTAAAVTLTLFTAGCSTRFATTEAALWRTQEIRYYHATASAGPSLITREDATILEERRYEPFGTPIDAFRETAPGATEAAAVDFRLDPHNILNKKTDPDTAWSYHGARWLAPDTARWLCPDPPVKAPDPKFLADPWALHPYQYVKQNPILFWDPDGRDAEHVEVYSNGSVYLHAHGSNGREFNYIMIPGHKLYDEGRFVGKAIYDNNRHFAKELEAGRVDIAVAYVDAADDVAFKLWLTSVKIGASGASASLSTAAGIVDFIVGVHDASNAIRDCQGDSLCAAEVWIETTAPGLPGLGPAAKGVRPPNLSPLGARRRGAFREAKRRSGVPVSQQPSRVGPNLDRRGNRQPGRTYEFDQGGGKDPIRIREDSGGHHYGPGDDQNRGPHFNDPADNHYDY